MSRPPIIFLEQMSSSWLQDVASGNLRWGPCVPAKTYGDSQTVIEALHVRIVVCPRTHPDFPVLMRGCIVGMRDRWEQRTGRQHALIDNLVERYIRRYKITVLDPRDVYDVVSAVETRYRRKFGCTAHVPSSTRWYTDRVIVGGRKFWRDSLDWRQLGALKRAQSFMRRADIELARAQRGLVRASTAARAGQQAAE